MTGELSGRDNSVRAVVSNQTDIYKDLEQVVRKYATTRFLRPIADHTRAAFESARQFVQQFYGTTGKHDVILDSGCGTGESTLHLARKFIGVPVIGIDKSAMRLNKAGNIHQLDNVVSELNRDATPGLTGNLERPDSRFRENDKQNDNKVVPRNVFWIRAELLDFWRLALEEVEAGRWNILHHAIYYPNPWPKESEATRRFHLHPIFPTLFALGNVTELRTNWEIYAKEFAEAAKILSDPSAFSKASESSRATVILEAFAPSNPETAFERKYKEARQQLWRVLVKR